MKANNRCACIMMCSIFFGLAALGGLIALIVLSVSEDNYYYGDCYSYATYDEDYGNYDYC